MLADRRHAIITGATSGIGLAVAEMFAIAGHDLSICSRNIEDTKHMADKLDSLRGSGGATFAARCDVSVSSDVGQFVAEAVSNNGPVGILVNNAGRSGGGPTADLDDALWSDVIRTNLDSVFFVTRTVLKAGGMLESGWGRIVNIASTAGKQGVVLGAPYSASKHGVVGFTKSLGNELGSSGITVNAVCPGYVETPMAERVRAGYSAAWGISEAEVLSRFEAKIPLGRYSQPAEVASLVNYLTTDSAASITAQALNVCGGLGNF